MILHAERMAGVKPQLVMLIIEAGVYTDFVVTCGMRTPQDQAKAVADGKSQTMNSKHLTGDAVDLAVLDKDGRITWEFGKYAELAQIVKSVARKRGVAITWGGDWRTLKDGPHFELSQGVSA